MLLSEVANTYHAFYDTINHIGNMDEVNGESSYEANNLVSKLEDFPFVFQLFTYEQVFPNIDVAFDTLKHKAMDVAACKASIEELVQHIQRKKSDSAFDSVYQKAESLAQHPCKSLKWTDDLDPLTHFKAVYYVALETLISQIQVCYAHLDDLRFLELLDPAKFTDINIHFATDVLDSLAKLYGGFFNMDRLRVDLKAFYTGQGQQQDSHKLCFIRSQKNPLPELYKLMCLVVTIGVTSANMEESFPCLKRIQDFVKGEKQDDQLHQNMAMMCIENEQLRVCQELGEWRWYDKVTNLWARKTKREDEFITKVCHL